jgi:hypothetical protein
VLPEAAKKPRSRFWPFVLGVVVGAASLFGLALFVAMRAH